MRRKFDLNPALIEHWALDLLAQKGHRIGAAKGGTGGFEIEIDEIWRECAELMQMARLYPEWPVRQQHHLEYVRQNRKAA